MATVRFSEQLRSAITSKASATFGERVRKAANTEQFATDGWPKRVYDRVMSPYQNHINELPKEFFHQTDQIQVYMRVPVELTDDAGATRRYSVDLMFGGSIGGTRMLPRNMPSHVGVNLTYRGWELDPTNPLWVDLREEGVVWAANLCRLKNQQDAFVTSVKKLIEAHVTLAPAIKAWPPLWDLVPEEYKAKHREVVERKKAEKTAEDLGIDLNSMTATLVAHKIQGGK